MLGAGTAAVTKDIQLLSTTNITSTGSQTYNIPSGTQYLDIEMWGGGGGGGYGNASVGRSGSAYQNGGGGGGGGYVKYRYYATDTGISDPETTDKLYFTVGEGGQGWLPNVSGAAAEDGEDTTLDTHKRESSEGVFTLVTFDTVIAGRGQGGSNAFKVALGGDSDGGIGSVGTDDDGGQGLSVTVANGSDGQVRDSQSASQMSGNNGGDAGGSGGDGGTAAHYSGQEATVGAQPGGGGGAGAGIQIGNARNGADGGHGQVTIKAYG
tara:strand:- start:551 stop:1348 length:798 start_codon:yes stop_codon:yes gene_type:complete